MFIVRGIKATNFLSGNTMTDLGLQLTETAILAFRRQFSLQNHVVKDHNIVAINGNGFRLTFDKIDNILAIFADTPTSMKIGQVTVFVKEIRPNDTLEQLVEEIRALKETIGESNTNHFIKHLSEMVTG